MFWSLFIVKSLGLSALGLRVINSDKAFENGLKKAGRSLDLSKGVDDIKDIRGKAKKITAKTLDQSIQGRLGLVFDTTSADAGKIAKQFGSAELLDMQLADGTKVLLKKKQSFKFRQILSIYEDKPSIRPEKTRQAWR